LRIVGSFELREGRSGGPLVNIPLHRGGSVGSSGPNVGLRLSVLSPSCFRAVLVVFAALV
jgi:hypothetical protein